MPESGEDVNLAKLHMMAAGDNLIPLGHSSHAANGEVAVGMENGSINGALHCMTHLHCLAPRRRSCPTTLRCYDTFLACRHPA